MLLESLKRLEATVEAETEALAANAPFDLEAVNRAKSRSLLELTRLARAVDVTALDAETALPRWRATWVDGRIAAEDVARDARDAATPA